MLKSLKKRSYRFVVVLLLLTTLLTFDVGRVTKVEAVATTAAIVGEVLLGLGVTYIAYQTLTGANVYVPGYEETDMYEYIRGLGRDFSKSASGSRLFSDLYNKLVVDDTYSVIDFTQDRLKDIYNDNKSVEYMQSISSFEAEFSPPRVDYDYGFDLASPSTKLKIGSTIYDSYYEFYPTTDYFIEFPSGPRCIIGESNGVGIVVNTTLDENARNYHRTNDSYWYIQDYVNGEYTLNFPNTYYSPIVHSLTNQSWYRYLRYSYNNGYWEISDSRGTVNHSSPFYPLMIDAPIYDPATGELIPALDIQGNIVKSPQYPNNTDNNGNKYPLVPYVQLPSNNKWGFNWRDALTDLVNGGARLITYSWLADLINNFKNSLAGTGNDIDYNYFNEGDTYYITYYSNTVNDIDNPVYNINVSEQEDVIPVDLNTIQQYTDNQYLTLIKQRAETFGETFGELVAFWHNCDPEIVYAFLGASIIVLLGAFIGKWGHS